MLVGITAPASASYGCRALWPQRGAAPQVDAEQANVLVEPPTASNPQANPPLVVTQKTPVVETHEVKEKELAKGDGVRKKKLPKGKLHQRQEIMLSGMLNRLHSDAYQYFINQPGMGMGRMTPLLKVLQREWKMPEWTSEQLAKEPLPQKGAKDLGLIHRLSLKKFGDMATKDLVERWAPEMLDLETTKEPAKALLWEIKSLDLIGLVVHDPPMVYMSDKIPVMKELKQKPTRELDLFATEGLVELANGKELYVRSKDTTIRVLGPIYAGKACLKCHTAAQEGDMLGAFSYTLREGLYQMNRKGAKVPPGGVLIPVLPFGFF